MQQQIHAEGEFTRMQLDDLKEYIKTDTSNLFQKDSEMALT